MKTITTLSKLEKLENKFEEVSLKIEAIENKIYEYEEKEKCVFSLESKKMNLETKQYEIQEKIEEIEKNFSYEATLDTASATKGIKERTTYYQFHGVVSENRIYTTSLDEIYTVTRNSMNSKYYLTIHNLDSRRSTLYKISKSYTETILREITALSISALR